MSAFRKIVRFFLLICACAVFCAACLGIKAANVCKFRDLEGTRTFYLNSASSQALMKTTLEVRDLDKIEGESVSLVVVESGETFVKEVFEKYGAEILIKEEACGIVSYYGYTPAWKENVFVDGKKINLHVSVKNSRAVVGSPIVFGGF